MSRRERNLVKLFVAIFALYALPFELAPALWGYLQGHQREVEALRERIARHERLLQTQEQWYARHREYVAMAEGYEQALIRGDTPDLIGARVIGELRRLSSGAGATVKSMDLPEFNSTGEWLFVTQTIHFSIPGAKLHRYIDALVESAHRFKVVSLDARSVRGNVEGSVKVVGFARAGGGGEPLVPAPGAAGAVRGGAPGAGEVA